MVILLSKSNIASIHGSPTFVSKIIEASDGGTVISDRRLDSGLSILC